MKAPYIIAVLAVTTFAPTVADRAQGQAIPEEVERVHLAALRHFVTFHRTEWDVRGRIALDGTVLRSGGRLVSGLDMLRERLGLVADYSVSCPEAPGQSHRCELHGAERVFWIGETQIEDSTASVVLRTKGQLARAREGMSAVPHREYTLTLERAGNRWLVVEMHLTLSSS